MSPDVIGMIEVENLAVLKKLAERINKDTIAAGKPNPKYEAYLIDGNDGRGIDSVSRQIIACQRTGSQTVRQGRQI